MEDRVRELVRRHVEAASAEQLEQAEYGVKAVRTKAAASGGLGSGRTLLQIAEVCASTADLRVQHAWATLRQALIAGGVRATPQLAQEIKDLVRAMVPADLPDLRRVAVQHAGEHPNLHERLDRVVTQAYERALQRVDLDADLFAMASETAERQEGETQQAGRQQIIFNGGTFGAVQFGAQSVANVNSTFDGAAREQLIRFVDEAHARIAEHGEQLAEREELLSMLLEAKAEATREKPPKAKMKALLGYVGGAVQVIAALKPAAEAISRALEYLG